MLRLLLHPALRPSMFALHPPSHNRLSTFAHQRTLPRLPVPTLKQTLDKYLQTLEPLLDEQESRGEGDGKEAELKRRKAWVEDFESGIGKKLQERLIDIDRSSPNNWLDDNFWMKKAYHEWRAPLIIHSNWWLLFHSDTTIPQEAVDRPPQDGEFGEWQVRRAAWLVGRFLDFKDKVDREEIHPDSSRTGLWFNPHARRLFNLSRIPKRGCDMLSRKPKERDPGARDIMVLLKGWVYTVEALRADGTIVDAGELEKRLWEVVKDVQGREAAGEKGEGVEILTADDRDVWAGNREYLLTLSPTTNRTSLTRLENTLFSLCLDPYTLPSPSSPVQAHVQNCRSGRLGLNRWYDKALTVMVESNGRAGMMGEHSPCDALIPSIIVDYAVAEPIDLSAFVPVPGQAEVDVGSLQDEFAAGAGRGWERVEWVLDDKMRAEIEGAKERARTVVEDSDATQLWYDAYGADWIKKNAKSSPDAYLQMALQLAYYKAQGEFTATYETASTRLFAHGRTDVIRTYSKDSRAFVLAMLDSSATSEARYAALSRATTSHNAYTRESSTGKGIDRHLMGLRLMLLPEEASAGVKLFDDGLFAKSQEWKLSTSGLSEGGRFHGTGFGTVWPDGYGINYLAGGDLIKFGIESKFSCPETSTEKLREKLVESLGEMRRVCEEGQGLSAKL